MAGPTSWCDGRAATRRATVRRHLKASGQPDQLLGSYCCLQLASSRQPDAPFLAPPLPHLLPPLPPRPRPSPPAGFTVDAAPLVGRTLFYWWPDDGRQRGSAARTCPRGAFSHVTVVAYHRQTSALRCTADTLLDAVSYGSRWVLLSPAPAAGFARSLLPRPGLWVWLVARHGHCSLPGAGPGCLCAGGRPGLSLGRAKQRQRATVQVIRSTMRPLSQSLPGHRDCQGTGPGGARAVPR